MIRCMVCKRPLKSKQSVAKGVGPGCLRLLRLGYRGIQAELEIGNFKELEGLLKEKEKQNVPKV